MTNFSVSLAYLDRGMLNEELGEALAKVVKGVRETGKAGQLTLTLKVGKGEQEDAVIIQSGVTTKIPEPARTKTLLHSTADGDLMEP